MSQEANSSHAQSGASNPEEAPITSGGLMSIVVWACMLVTTAAGAVWLLKTDWPLGVPGEWTWSRIPWTQAHPWIWISGLFSAVIFLGLVWFVSGRLKTDHQTSTWWKTLSASLIVAAITGGWWTSLLSSVPDPYGSSRGALVIFYPRMTGYFHEARYKEGDTASFLATYEQMLKNLRGPDKYLHIGTHPPGMILLNRGLIAATNGSPALASLLQATMPTSIKESTDLIRNESIASRREFTANDANALWLAVLTSYVLCALTVVPLASLLRSMGQSEQSALRWAALWGLMPAVLVFLPKCDTLLAFPAGLAGSLWVNALLTDTRWRAFLAGVVCFVGLLISLAFLPVMLWLVMATIIFWIREPDRADGKRHTRSRARAMAAGLTGLLIPVIAIGAAARVDMAAIWRLNLANHAEFYQHNTRTYFSWLVANTGELAIAAGPALLVLALASTIGAIIRWVKASEALREQSAFRWSLLGAAGLLVLGILWLSGKNMGEAARLWILFLPWLVLSAPPRETHGSLPESRTFPSALWFTLGLMQAVACVAAVSQIDGFGFSEL